MAGGLFSRLKIWRLRENLKSTDANAEFNNIIQNLKPEKFDDYSLTVSQMQETLFPGSVGSEVQPVSLAEEIKELRYQLDAIIGDAQWYSAPANTIAALNSGISSLLSQASNRISTGRVDGNSQPMFLTPAGASAAASLKATATNFTAFINGVSRTAALDITVTGLTAAPSVNNTALVNDAALVGQQSSKTQGERDSVITIDTIGANITALNGTYAAFKRTTEIFLAEIDTTNNRLKNCFRGFFFDSTDATLSRQALSDNDSLTLLKLTWFFYLNNGVSSSLDVTYANPRIQYTQPSSPSIGDYWLDLSTSQWKKYSGVAFVAANAVLIGVTAQDTTNCIAARSFDFANPFATKNTLELEYVDANNVRTSKQNNQISVYGTIVQFNYDHTRWSMSTDRDTGVSDSATTTYYFYITPTGSVKISDQAPNLRKYDLLGDYHPSKPWRCVGQIDNDGAAAFTSTSLNFALYNENRHDGSSLEIAAGIARIKDSGVTTAKIAALNVTRPKLVAVGQQTASTSSFSTTSAAFTDVSSLTVTITTTGRPVVIALISTGTAGYISVSATGIPSAELRVLRDAVVVADMLYANAAATATIWYWPISSFFHIDVVAAGTYVYKMQAKHSTGGAGNAISLTEAQLIAYEL